jgi:hypothetical protein
MCGALMLLTPCIVVIDPMQAISDRTMMMPQDIMDTLKQLNLLSYWKGQHFIAAPAKVVEDYWKMYNAPGAHCQCCWPRNLPLSPHQQLEVGAVVFALFLLQQYECGVSTVIFAF